MTRLEANRKILELISAEVEAFPDGRFGQILVNLGITKPYEIYDEWLAMETDNGTIKYNHIDFYEEPIITIKRAFGE